MWQLQSSHSPDCFSLDKKVHQALCWNADLGRELRRRIGTTDQWCKLGQPASLPAICITPGFRTAIHHCHYKLNLLSINDFVYHHGLGWSFWPVGRVLLVFLSSFTLVEFLDDNFSLLKHFKCGFNQSRFCFIYKFCKHVFSGLTQAVNKTVH